MEKFQSFCQFSYLLTFVEFVMRSEYVFCDFKMILFDLYQGFSTSVLLTFWIDNSLLWETGLCIVGCFKASLASVH